MINCNYTSNTSYNFYGRCCSADDHISVTGVYDPNKIESVLECGTSSNKWVQFFIPEIVDIPEQKPDIEAIVSIHSCIEIISQKVIRTPVVTGYTGSDGIFIPGQDINNSECTKLTGKKLIIEGILKQKVVYTAAVEEQSLHSACFNTPFSVFIIVDATTPLTQAFKVTSYIEDIFSCRLSERSIFKNTTIFMKAFALC